MNNKRFEEIKAHLALNDRCLKHKSVSIEATRDCIAEIERLRRLVRIYKYRDCHSCEGYTLDKTDIDRRCATCGQNGDNWSIREGIE